jgi:hypothetical protein
MVSSLYRAGSCSTLTVLPAVPNDQCQQNAKPSQTKKHTKRNGHSFKDSSTSIAIQKETEVISEAVEDSPDAEFEV